LFSVGGSIGATLAPLLVIPLADVTGWRSVFVLTGALGLALGLFWLLAYRHPRRQPDADETPAPALTERQLWKAVVAMPAVWALVTARMLTDPVWYFFQFWMPKYLHAERGFDQVDLGWLWLVFLAGDIGFIGGGLLSDRLVKGGREPRAARR